MLNICFLLEKLLAGSANGKKSLPVISVRLCQALPISAFQRARIGVSAWRYRRFSVDNFGGMLGTPCQTRDYVVWRFYRRFSVDKSCHPQACPQSVGDTSSTWPARACHQRHSQPARRIDGADRWNKSEATIERYRCDGVGPMVTASKTSSSSNLLPVQQTLPRPFTSIQFDSHNHNRTRLRIPCR